MRGRKNLSTAFFRVSRRISERFLQGRERRTLRLIISMISCSRDPRRERVNGSALTLRDKVEAISLSLAVSFYLYERLFERAGEFDGASSQST